MIYHGTVQDGVVTFPPGVQLPDGMKVVVQPESETPTENSPTEFPGEVRNGVPMFPPRDNDFRPDLEFVNKLRDELP